MDEFNTDKYELVGFLKPEQAMTLSIINRLAKLMSDTHDELNDIVATATIVKTGKSKQEMVEIHEGCQFDAQSKTVVSIKTGEVLLDGVDDCIDIVENVIKLNQFLREKTEAYWNKIFDSLNIDPELRECRYTVVKGEILYRRR